MSMQGISAVPPLVVFVGFFYLFRIQLSFQSYMPETTRPASRQAHAGTSWDTGP